VDPKNLTLPRRLLPEDEEEHLKAMTQACIGAAVGRNYIFSKLGKYITKSQIVYLNTPKPPTGEMAGGLQKSDTDELLDFFESTEDISYHTLWDVPLLNGQSGLISEVHPFDDEGLPCEIDHREDPDMEEPRLMAEAVRSNPKVSPQAKVFIAVAWASKADIRFFKLFPEVVHCDATCDSNNTGNHLLTFSCRTSTGKQYVFLKIWIPNQKRFTFRWVFKFVIMHLLPQKIFCRTNLFMVDGDPQQRAELVKAIKEFVSHAEDGSCGWHLVSQGWKRHGPTNTCVTTKPQRDRFDLFKTHVCDWIYSWMTPGRAENEEEYSVSNRSSLGQERREMYAGFPSIR
jgi:hypothetical protein